MKIISLNANGIRAAARKGFFDWMPEQNADVICIQETKAQVDQLSDAIFHPEGYHCYYFDAQKKGYSGVAIYCKEKPDNVISGFGEGFEEFDAEGRYIEAQFNDLSIASIYVPSGSSKPEAQEKKDRFLETYMPRLREQAQNGRKYIIVGDWNIAHKEQDIKNWKGNLKNSGFLPHERAWLTALFDDIGFIDAFREIEQPEHSYTWWSNRGQAWVNNTGWRIDYHINSSHFKDKVLNTEIYKHERFSDHAPLIIEYTTP